MKWKAFNLNETVRVKLTPLGRTLHQDRWNALFKDVLDRFPYMPVKEDKDGYSEWQLWDLMDCMASTLHMGALPAFERNNIEFEIEED